MSSMQKRRRVGLRLKLDSRDFSFPHTNIQRNVAVSLNSKETLHGASLDNILRLVKVLNLCDMIGARL